MRRYTDLYFKNFNENLFIKNGDSLNELIYIIKLANLLLDDVYNNDNLEAFYEAFFQVKIRLEKENLVL